MYTVLQTSLQPVATSSSRGPSSKRLTTCSERGCDRHSPVQGSRKQVTRILRICGAVLKHRCARLWEELNSKSNGLRGVAGHADYTLTQNLNLTLSVLTAHFNLEDPCRLLALSLQAGR